MNAEIETFLAEVRGRRGTRRKGAAPYDAEMIARGRALAMGLLEGGEPAVSVGRRLGVARKTLMKWIGEGAASGARSKASAGFVRVGLKSARKEAVAGPATVQLVSPRGYRIEGLDVPTTLAILREVG